MACNQANEVRFSCNYWKPDPSMTESSLFLHLSKPQFPRDNMVERGETFGLVQRGIRKLSGEVALSCRDF